MHHFTMVSPVLDARDFGTNGIARYVITALTLKNTNLPANPPLQIWRISFGCPDIDTALLELQNYYLKSHPECDVSYVITSQDRDGKLVPG